MLVAAASDDNCYIELLSLLLGVVRFVCCPEYPLVVASDCCIGLSEHKVYADADVWTYIPQRGVHYLIICLQKKHF